METMKAARIHQYGDPDLLGYEEASSILRAMSSRRGKKRNHGLTTVWQARALTCSRSARRMRLGVEMEKKETRHFGRKECQ